MSSNANLSLINKKKYIDFDLCINNVIKILSRRKAYYYCTSFHDYDIGGMRDLPTVPIEIQTPEKRDKMHRYIYNYVYNYKVKLCYLKVKDFLKNINDSFKTNTAYDIQKIRLINYHWMYISQLLMQIYEESGEKEMIKNLDYLKKAVLSIENKDIKFPMCREMVYVLMREFQEHYHYCGSLYIYTLYFENIAEGLYDSWELISCLDSQKMSRFITRILQIVNPKKCFEEFEFLQLTSADRNKNAFIYWKNMTTNNYDNNNNDSKYYKDNQFNKFDIKTFQNMDRHIHEQIVNYCVGLFEIKLPPYIILKIIDYCGFKHLWPRKQKINIINNIVIKFRKERMENRLK